MSSSGEDDTYDRTRGKGDNRDDNDGDPADGFEDEPESEQAESAQATIDSFAEDEDEGPQAVYTADELSDSDIANDVSQITSSNSEQIQSLGGENLSPDAPDGANIDDAVVFEQMNLSSTFSGAAGSSMWIGQTALGDDMYITFQNDQSNAMEMTAVANSMKSALSEAGQTRVGFPAMHVDAERDASVLASAGETHTAQYDPTDADVTFTKESYADAVAAKALLGDDDIGGNIVVSEDGEFHPIDFDLGGANIKSKDKMYEENTRLHATKDGFVDSITTSAYYPTIDYDFDLSDEDVRDAMQRVANEVDIETYRSNLETANVEIPESTIEDMVENIRIARRREI